MATRARLSAIAASIIRPSSRRFSVTKAMPCAIRWRTDPVRGTPFRSIRPSVIGSTPATMRASSLRPDPIRPNRPRISPLRTVRSTRCTMPGCDTSASVRTGSAPGAAVRGGNIPPISRPIIFWIIRGMPNSAMAPSATSRPSRRTATLSDSRCTSPRICEM